MFALLLLQAQPVSDRAMNSWAGILKAASTNPYALFGLVILVVGTVLLIAAQNWAKVIGAVGLIAGAVIVIYIVNGLARPEKLTPYSGRVIDSSSKRPVHNAAVSVVIPNNGVTLSDHTDSDGLYRVFIYAAWLNMPAKVTAHADKYSDVDKNVLLAKSTAAPDFELDPFDRPAKPPDSLRVDKLALLASATVRPEMVSHRGSVAEQRSYVPIPVSRSSGKKPSGTRAEFSPWYDLCLERPTVACSLESPEYSLRGDRTCGQWAECKLTQVSPERVCFSFRMQGHSEWAGAGQAYSEGVLSATCRLSVNPKSPVITKILKNDLIPAEQIRDGHIVKASLTAPGKIVYVQYSCDGPACPWIHQCDSGEPCVQPIEYNGNTATWYGWTNSGAPAALTFAVQYQ